MKKSYHQLAGKYNFHIAAEIRKYRKAEGLSLRKFAKLAGIPDGTLRGIEGAKHNPRLSTLILLADALGRSLDNLCGRRENA